jgi:hypothetical protein
MEELRAFAAQMPPWAARSMEKEVRAPRITREDVDAFLRQSPPRKIPRNLAYHYHTAFGTTVMGAIFIAIASLVTVVLGAHGEWRVVMFAGGMFWLMGAPLLFFGGRRWWRQRRLLRRGELVAAKIVSVDPAGYADDDGEVFNMTARYQAGGQSREGQCKVWSQRAKRLAAEGKPAAILYDPTHPERIFFIEGLVNS